jgi:hypothetical protein
MRFTLRRNAETLAVVEEGLTGCAAGGTGKGEGAVMVDTRPLVWDVLLPTDTVIISFS